MEYNHPDMIQRKTRTWLRLDRGMGNDLSLIILAGGQSSRMGQDKAWMMLEGRPLIERVVRRLLPLAGEVLISANDPDRYEVLLRSLPAPGQIVADRYPGYGPLAGIHAGLSVARNDLALVIAADMPFVNSDLLRYMIGLAGSYDGVVPNSDLSQGRLAPEPLHALYRRSCLSAIEHHLLAGDRRIVSFFPDVNLKQIAPADVRLHDPELRSFFNVNTPGDWLQMQRLVRKASS
jgi:molybdopterin-guanine dinucleotide biosynthesis protein A